MVVEGATPNTASSLAPSPMLRMVPLPRFMGEDQVATAPRLR